jgi:hypothetical protein
MLIDAFVKQTKNEYKMVLVGSSDRAKQAASLLEVARFQIHITSRFHSNENSDNKTFKERSSLNGSNNDGLREAFPVTMAGGAMKTHKDNRRQLCHMNQQHLLN